MLISQEDSFEDGIRRAQELIEGSCSLLLLTERGIYAARDRLGRTPLVVGRPETGPPRSAPETCAFPNLDFTTDHFLGPGEVRAAHRRRRGNSCCRPATRLQICSFLWVYYGYPASEYEGHQRRGGPQPLRRRPGPARRRRGGRRRRHPRLGHRPRHRLRQRAEDPLQPALRQVHAHLAAQLHAPGPGDARPGGQDEADPDPAADRGPAGCCSARTPSSAAPNSRTTSSSLFDFGAREVHMRPACPPLIFACKFLNFSTSRSTLDLAGRKAIHAIEGDRRKNLDRYARDGSAEHEAMVEALRAPARPDLAPLPAPRRPGGRHRPAQGTPLHPLLEQGLLPLKPGPTRHRHPARTGRTGVGPPALRTTCHANGEPCNSNSISPRPGVPACSPPATARAK